MSKPFHPYQQWLGITNAEAPPNRYQLLGLETFTDDSERIARAADAAMAQLRKIRPGEHAAEWSQLLDELARAKQCLLDPIEKEAYDDALRMQGRLPPNATPDAKPVASPPVPPTPPAASDDLPLEDDLGEANGASWMGLVVTCLMATLIGLAGLLCYRLVHQSQNLAEILRPIAPAEPAGPPRTKVPTVASKPSQPRSLPQKPQREHRLEVSPRPPTMPTPANTVNSGHQPANRRESAAPPADKPASTQPPPPPAPVVDRAKAAAFLQAATEVRAAFVHRNLAAARQALSNATANAQTSEDAARLDRLQSMLDSLTQFWEGIGAAMARFQQTEELAYRDQRMVVVESGRDHLVVRAEGRVQKFRATELPSWLVMTIADRDFGKDPGSKAIIATFLAVDPYGNRAAARRYWEEAARAGYDCAKLLPELAETYPAE